MNRSRGEKVCVRGGWRCKKFCWPEGRRTAAAASHEQNGSKAFARAAAGWLASGRCLTPSRALNDDGTQTRQDEALSQRRQLESLFAKDTADAYRVFETMEHFLRQPEHLQGQLQVQLGDSTQVTVALQKKKKKEKKSLSARLFVVGSVMRTFFVCV